MFKIEAWLLAPVRFDQSGCIPALPTSHEVCSCICIWSPGYVKVSRYIKRNEFLPAAVDWAPLYRRGQKNGYILSYSGQVMKGYKNKINY